MRPDKVFISTVFCRRSDFWLHREAIGPQLFDKQFKAIHEYINSMQPGQFFYARNLCKRNPDNVWLVLYFAKIYFQCHFFEELDIDYDEGKVTRLAPNPKGGPWSGYPIRWPWMFVRRWIMEQELEIYGDHLDPEL